MLKVLQIIDTTLLKCYLKSKENLAHVFLRIHPNYLHLEVSERLLFQHNKLSELITLYERKDAHEKALNLLMTESSKSNSALAGLKYLVDYLKKLGNKNLELIFKYAKYVIEKDVSKGMKIFFAGDPAKVDELLVRKSNEINESLTKLKRNSTSSPIQPLVNNQQQRKPLLSDLDMSDFDDDSLKELDHELVVKFFQESIEPKELSALLIRMYLQYCIFLWTDKKPHLSNLLIDIYKQFVEVFYKNIPRSDLLLNPALEQSATYRKLLKFYLSEIGSYDFSFALSKLDLDQYPEERAIVLGRMDRHHEALNIYVNKVWITLF